MHLLKIGLRIVALGEGDKLLDRPLWEAKIIWLNAEQGSLLSKLIEVELVRGKVDVYNLVDHLISSQFKAAQINVCADVWLLRGNIH